MNPHVAASLARGLMNAHGLQHVPFAFDASRKRMGACHWDRLTRKVSKITLSVDLVMRATESKVHDTILHEIAHALAGHQAGHGERWKQVARSIGCTAERCFEYGIDTVTPVPGEWQATCGGCGKVYHQHRAPKVNATMFKYCKDCGKIRGRLTFLHKG